MRRTLTTLLLACTLATPFSYAKDAKVDVTPKVEINKEKRALIDELLTVSGADKLGEIMSTAFVQQISTVLRQRRSDIDPKAFDIIEEETNAVVKEELIDKKVIYEINYPLYDKHFTTEDLKGLVSFYKTPLGRKAVKALPQITQESMQASQQAGALIGPKIQMRVFSRFKEEGIEVQ